jgi:hypothetical protein
MRVRVLIGDELRHARTGGVTFQRPRPLVEAPEGGELFPSSSYSSPFAMLRQRAGKARK